MADFRKLLLALIVGALLFGTFANAQTFSCQVAAVPTWVRSEANADYVGDVLLACGGIVPPLPGGAGLTGDISLTLGGLSITSKMLTSPITEATLVLDGAIWPDGSRHPKGYKSVSGGVLVPFEDGSQNIYQADLNTAGTELTWRGVVLVGPGSVFPGQTAIRSILLTNVRVNAQGVPLATDIKALVRLVSPTFVPLFGDNPPVVATVRQGLFITYQPISLKNCDLLPDGRLSFTTTFLEGWGSAFKPRINTTVLTNPPHYVPGGGYFDESGFNPVGFASGVNGGAGPTGLVNSGVSNGGPVGPGGALDVNSFLVGLASIGLATQGTQFQLVVSSIPTGVTLTTPASVTNANGLTVVLVSQTAGPGLNAQTFLWEVQPFAYTTALGAPAQSAVDSVVVTINGAYGMPPVTGLAKVHARFWPDTLSVGPPVPRFYDPDPNGLADAIKIDQSCKTMLLFPYLTTAAGYNTGIVISNTSWDPLGQTPVPAPLTSTPGPVIFPLPTSSPAVPGYAATRPQSGNCTMYFYGQNAGVALTQAQAEQTTKDIPAGGQFIMVLSGGVSPGTIYSTAGRYLGPALQTTPACAPGGTNTCGALANFTGYGIAACNFQWAHGYAFITDMFSDRTNGYLALVIPDRGTALLPGQGRLPQDDSLANNTLFGFNQGEQLGN